MSASASFTRHFVHLTLGVAIVAALGLSASACSSIPSAETGSPTVTETATARPAVTETIMANPSGPTSTSTPSSGHAVTSSAGTEFFDGSTIHQISVSFLQEDYDAMVQTFKDSGDKEWIAATVTIDGKSHPNAGMRLKGNSSIMGLGGNGRAPKGGNVSATEPETLPWLISLDKNVSGQSHDGITDFVVRSNTTQTSLNEAVSLELLDLASLESLRSVMAGFSVNGGTAKLRLVTELPNDLWMAEHFGTSGALYKAEATGDYSYRGDDPDAYDQVFDQEAGKANADLTPLIEFLDFVNNSDDATFASQLAERLDVDSFATYLAMEDLLGNFDDIDGPGNNSYLYYDRSTGRFTVVPWDHNLAFGKGFGPGDRGPGGAGDQMVPGGQTQNGAKPVTPGGQTQNGAARPPVQQGGGMRGGPGKANVLTQRFHANDEFEKLYEERLSELRGRLYASGTAADVLQRWVDVLESQGSTLVSSATVQQEATNISAFFTAQ